jgi:Sec-independent protein secretion pathway component TatC
MTIFQIISQEAWFKIYYCFFSFILCGMVNFYFISSWAIIFCLPMTELNPSAQFIFTEVDEAFGTACFMACYTSLQFCFPLFCYECITFCNPALFKTESVKFARLGFFFVLLNVYFHLYGLNILMQNLLSFFLQFQFKFYTYSILTFQAKIFAYVKFVVLWCLMFQSCLVICCLSFLACPKFLMKVWLHKKYFLFLMLALFVAFIIPPDAFIQFLITVSLFATLDLFGFLLFLSIAYQEKALI